MKVADIQHIREVRMETELRLNKTHGITAIKNNYAKGFIDHKTALRQLVAMGLSVEQAEVEISNP